MPMERFSYSREEIYAAVWAQPMRDACKQFGISDVAFAKVCRRLKVPRPKHGYWLRKSIGQDPPKKALPAAGPETPQTWEGQRWREPAPSPSAPGAESSRPARDPTLDEHIEVPDTIGELHPILLASAKLLEKPGAAARWERPCVSINVSPPLLDRALRIMQALFLALEKRGLRVEVTAPEESPTRSSGPPEKFPSATGVHVGDEFVTFTLYEDHDIVTIPPPKPKPIRLPSGRMYTSPWTPASTYEHHRNGKLVLKLLSPGRSPGWGHVGPRTVWSDGTRQRIEQRLHRFVEALLQAGERIHRERVEADRRERERQEAEKRRVEAEARRREEEEKVKKLRITLDEWREVRDIQAFIAEARSIVAAGGHVIEAGSNLDDFIRWATARASRLDPFRVLWRDASEPPAAASTVADRGP